MQTVVAQRVALNGRICRTEIRGLKCSYSWKHCETSLRGETILSCVGYWEIWDLLLVVGVDTGSDSVKLTRLPWRLASRLFHPT